MGTGKSSGLKKFFVIATQVLAVTGFLAWFFLRKKKQREKRSK